MRIVNQEVQDVCLVPSTYEDTLSHIEKLGRICYQSEGKITETSAEKFCKMLFDRKHHAMIEHSWLVMKVYDVDKEASNYLDFIFDSKFITTYNIGYGITYVCGNWRAFIDCFDKTDDWGFFSQMPEAITELPEMNRFRREIVHGFFIPKKVRAYSAIMKTDRAVTHELVRHRPASYAQESQRYCAYRDDVEFIQPYMYDKKDEDDEIHNAYNFWLHTISIIENAYKAMMRIYKEKPQEARSLLPNCTATQIAITADCDEWEHIFRMRTSEAAYPQIRRLMDEIETIFLYRHYSDEKVHPVKKD